MTALVVILVVLAAFVLISAFYHLDRLIRAEHDFHHDAWLTDGRPFFVWFARACWHRQPVCMDASLMGMAVLHAAVGSFVCRSRAAFAVASNLCSRLEPADYSFLLGRPNFCVFVTLSHLTNRMKPTARFTGSR